MARRRRITRQSSCTGKDKLRKNEALDRVFSLKRKEGAIMRAYRCKFRCKLTDGSVAWHVGHKHKQKPRYK